jgi:cell division protein FtsI/penicillin-binding protein 2
MASVGYPIMATWLSGTSKQLRTVRKNAAVWCGVFLVCLLLMLLRLFWLQIVQGSHFTTIARHYRNRERVLLATRGRLFDRNLTVMALDDDRRSVFIDPVLARQPAFVAAQLAPVIGRPAEEVLAALTYEYQQSWVKRDLTLTEVQQLATVRLPGVQV